MFTRFLFPFAMFRTSNWHDTPLVQNVVDEVAAVPPVHITDNDDYISAEDVDDEVAGQDDELVEDPVAPTSTAAPPLRRSKRVAAQRHVALRAGFAPSPYVTSGLRWSARLAGMPRVNYKY
jgi:hypothetical protein